MTEPTEAQVAAGRALVPLGDAPLDVDALADVTRGIGRTLSQAVSNSAALYRAQRTAELGDLPLGPEDVAPLVRRLTHARDVLDHFAKEVGRAVKATTQEIAEELDAVARPEEQRVPSRLVVPDADGTEIVVAAKTKKTTTWDETSIASVIADIATREAPPPDVAEDVPGDGTAAWADLIFRDGVRAGALIAVREVLRLGSVTWRITSLDALRRQLMAEGRDAVAGIIGRAKTENRTWDGESVDVIREPTKARRR